VSIAETKPVLACSAGVILLDIDGGYWVSSILLPSAYKGILGVGRAE
jgi:hypothetical protein